MADGSCLMAHACGIKSDKKLDTRPLVINTQFWLFRFTVSNETISSPLMGVCDAEGVGNTLGDFHEREKLRHIHQTRHMAHGSWSWPVAHGSLSWLVPHGQ